MFAVHSLVAMEALEATSTAAEVDPDLISKIRARHATRNRRARGYNVQAILWSRRRRSKFATVKIAADFRKEAAVYSGFAATLYT